MLVLTLRHGGETNDHIRMETLSGEIKVEILAVRNGKVRLGVARVGTAGDGSQLMSYVFEPLA